VPRRVVNSRPITRPASAFSESEPVIVRPIDPGRSSPDEVLHVLHEEHRLYWEKDLPTYLPYIGDDLLRIAEMGVRSREDLIKGMLDKLLRPVTPQVDERIYMIGNAAIATWRDAGKDDDGKPTQSWFTTIFVKRDGQWQLVQMHSTGIPPERIPSA